MRPLDAALRGAREIGFTVVSISVSLVAVFIPLLLMGGVIGRLFREFAMTVTAAIAVSVLVSLTLTPMLASRFLTRESTQHGRIYVAIERMFEALVNGYERGLNVVLRHRFITLMTFFATMRALPSLSLEYFGETAVGKTAWPALVAAGAEGAASFFSAFGAAVLLAGVAAGAAASEHSALRNSFHFIPLSVPAVWAALYFALHSCSEIA